MIGNLYGKIKDKNKRIAELKQPMANFNCQLVEKDKEISDVRVTLNTNKEEMRDA